MVSADRGIAIRGGSEGVRNGRVATAGPETYTAKMYRPTRRRILAGLAG